MKEKAGYDIQPIRDINKLQAMNAVLRARDPKYWCFFTLGIHTGLRISDILQLRVKDITDMTRITEQKTHKKRFLFINASIQQEIEAYVHEAGLEENDYLIPSRKHKDGVVQPIGRRQARLVLKEAAAVCGLDPRTIGTHSLRKTFGYHFYMKTKDIATLMYIFNHSSERVTLRYIGVTDTAIREQLASFQLV